MIRRIWNKILLKTLYRWNAKFLFGKVGSGTYCIKPLRIINGRYATIGSNCSILHFLRLEIYNERNDSLEVVKIGDGTNIEQNVHITAGKGITIGKNCSILAGSVITDIKHPYENVDIPASQTEHECKTVEIGDQCFIGTHSMIMPGVTLGKHVIVGANSVVTHSFPDKCVVAGVPAKMLKRYDDKLQEWVSCL